MSQRGANLNFYEP